MSVRQLSNHEADNLARLHEAGVSAAPLFVTATGLEKGILDATEPIRKLLADGGLHDFSDQAQGQVAKVFLPAEIFVSGKRTPCKISAYRPETKKGDPRIWPERFSSLAHAGEAWAITVHEGKLRLLSLSRSLLGHELDTSQPTSAETHWIAPLIFAANSTARELRNLLADLANRGPLKAIGHGTTAIGRTLEHFLGIPPNSSKLPDFKGIEIKSGRTAITGGEPRAQLFARVPDWQLSRFKSVSEFLRECGYDRDGARSLRCTVSSLRQNPQGLVLRVTNQLLEECSRKHNASPVLVWRMADLETALMQKHRETFWLHARSLQRKGTEFFELLSATHTRNPVPGQLARLLDVGGVTVDHMISEKTPGGLATEKGPSFKMQRERLAELFRGVPREYDLQAG
ncbi:MAG: hypothetical protein EAZ36_06250 [Verrucomicrobia bacterium]|nr:MAG: hypothetical protein EAZ36_06250 [Verrucomicrobiota bacterium]